MAGEFIEATEVGVRVGIGTKSVGGCGSPSSLAVGPFIVVVAGD